MSDKIREAQAMHLLNEISEAPNEVAIYACLDRIDVFLGKKEGVIEWPVAALAQKPTQSAPEEWMLVPVRATREQVNAVCMHPDLARTLYRSMVEAAPAAPAPAAQEPVAQCPFCGEPSGHCNQGFPHPRKTAKALCAAEQPDAVKVPRVLMERVAAMLTWNGEEYRELRALLGKESEDHE